MMKAFSPGVVLLALLWVPAAVPGVGQSHLDQRIKTVYVIPSSHWDLGFLAPPEQLLPRLKPHIDEVIANCKADPDFRWTIESSWQLREWFSRTKNPNDLRDFVNLVNRGQIQVSAAWGSMHTEFMGTEQLNRIVYEGRALQRELGFKSDFAMMDDVPGFSLMLPQVFARSGVKYFLTGSNLFIGGGTSLHPAKSPFYWQSPDGSKVLMWQTQGSNGGYTEALADYFLDGVAKDPYGSNQSSHFYPKEWKGLTSLDIMQRGMDKLLGEYQRAEYPYDSLLVMYLHDFISSGWERDRLLPNVRAWNAAGKEPRIVVATPAEFFRHLEAEHGGRFPTYSGDWTGLWSEVKTNSPTMSAKARWAQNHFPVAELIDVLRSLTKGPEAVASNIAGITLDLAKYDEHSGAGQYGWPKIMTRAEVEEQNREYAEYTSSAKNETHRLIAHGLADLFSEQQDPTFQHGIVVFNPLAWQRSEVVQLDVPGKEAIQIRDMGTNAIVSQERLPDDKVLFAVAEVPAFGYRTYRIEKRSDAEPQGTSDHDVTIENSFYRVELRPFDGAITSVYDKQLKLQLVDFSAGTKLNQILRWQGTRTLPVSDGKIAIERRRSALMQTLVIRREASYWPETRITLPAGQKLILMDNLVNRSKMPRMQDLTADLYGFSFPFRFTGASRLWVSDGIGFHRFPMDYLPGARTDAIVPRSAVAMESTEDTPPYHVVMSQQPSFFDGVLCQPAPKGGCGTFLNEIRAYAMRKADQGDTRDAGVVEFETPEPGMGPVYHFSFAITSSPGAFDPVSAYRAGAAFEVPLIPTVLPPSRRPASWVGDYLSVTAPEVTLLALKPSAEGSPHQYTFRLQEIAGSRVAFKLLCRWKMTAVDELNLTEDEVLRTNLDANQLSIGPHQTLTLRITLLQ